MDIIYRTNEGRKTLTIPDASIVKKSPPSEQDACRSLICRLLNTPE